MVRVFLIIISFTVLSVIPLLTERNDVLTWIIFTFLYIALSQSWNIMGGITGQQNLGHAAFFGIGALITRLMWIGSYPLPLSMLVAAAVSALFALIIGFPAFRLKGVYFIIGTLVMAEILRMLCDTILPTANIMPGKLMGSYSLIPRYYLSLSIAVLTLLVVYWISRSKLGIGLQSIREDEDAAEASGVSTQRYKLVALLISAFLAGLCGGAFAYYSIAVLPGYLFSAHWTFDAVIIVFVGGVGTILGPIIGSVFFVFLKQLLSLYLPGGSHVLIFGILFIFVVLYLPGGLIQLLSKLRLTRFGDRGH